MNLVIGENEGKILTFLATVPGARHNTIKEGTEIKIGSLGTTLKRMADKGWLDTRVILRDQPAPLRDTYTLYSLSELGERARMAWEHYLGA